LEEVGKNGARLGATHGVAHVDGKCRVRRFGETTEFARRGASAAASIAVILLVGMHGPTEFGT